MDFRRFIFQTIASPHKQTQRFFYSQLEKHLPAAYDLADYTMSANITARDTEVGNDHHCWWGVGEAVIRFARLLVQMGAGRN